MVSGLMPHDYSNTFAESPDDAEVADGGRYWWCPECGAVFDRHWKERVRKFCYNCYSRHAVCIEMQAVGPGADEVGA